MESKPLVNEPHADSGKWDNPRRIKVDEDKGRVREGSPSIRLCLGISSGYEKTSHVIKQGKSVFTAAQLQDLHQQFLIFKYMVAGFPLPIELIRPIWNSVAISLGSATGGIHTQYPNFVGFSPLRFDYRSMMDPEPGRCRRTDGKKWRCSKDVVPDQKYCERHMHRGRGRSRKLVNAYEITSESVPGKLHLATPSLKSSGNNSVVKDPTTSSIGSISGNENTIDAKKDSTTTTVAATPTTLGINKESNKNVCGDKDATTTSTTAIVLWSADAGKINDGRSNGEFVNGKDAEYKHLSSRINIRGSVNYISAGGGDNLVASGFGFSPNNALQVLGCSSSCLNYRNAIESKLQRCRRTDGKKWRCGGDVVPDHKYCERHLHRGAKKRTAAAQPVTVTSASLPPSFCLATPLAIPQKEGGYMNLDTNLSISIAASPQQTTNDEKSSTTSSSDATTISDESSSVSHLLALSP